MNLANSPHPEKWGAMIDTGADRTAIPIRICEELGIMSRDYGYPGTFDEGAQRKRCPLYWVTLRIAGLEDVPLKVFGVENRIIILGRDLLNKFSIMIDGPGSRWAMGHETRAAKLTPYRLLLR